MLQQRRKEERRENWRKLKIPSTQSEPKTTDVSTTRYSTDGLPHRPTSDVPASIAERNARPHRRNRRRNRQESIIESLARTWKRGSLRSDYVKLPLWGLLPLCPLYHRFKTTSHRTAETGNTIDTRAAYSTGTVLSWQTFETFSSSVAQKNETGKREKTRTHHSIYTLRMDGLHTGTKQKCTLFRPVSYDSSLVLIIRDAEYGTGDGVLLAVRSEQRSINRRVYFSL